jgi:hypothetical protein
MRALARAGYLRKEISKLLEIRYQHVRKVVVAAGIEGGLQRGVEAERLPILVEPPENKTRAETLWDVLLKAGFQQAGQWVAVADGTIGIDGKIPSHPGVYALVLDGVVVCVGLTLNGLQTRADPYRQGHKGQKTGARQRIDPICAGGGSDIDGSCGCARAVAMERASRGGGGIRSGPD